MFSIRNGVSATGLLSHEGVMPAVHVPLPIDALYRSRICVLKSSVNPLVAAAEPLLLLMGRWMCVSEYVCDDSVSLFNNLQHEIHSFENQAQSVGYSTEHILIARYMLCVAIDALLGRGDWGKEYWQVLLLNRFHPDAGTQHCVPLFEKLRRDVRVHLDVLELMYLCMQGLLVAESMKAESEMAQVLPLMDVLYQTIRWQRGDDTQTLWLKPTIEISATPRKKYTLAWTIGLLGVAIGYLTLNVLMVVTALPLWQLGQ